MVTIEQLLTCLVSPEHLFTLLYGMSVCCYQSIYTQAPRGEQLQSIVDGYASKWGFTQCVGAVDGSHIPIVSPLDCPADYYNQKGFHSTILQAVVDHGYRFGTSVLVGQGGYMICLCIY